MANQEAGSIRSMETPEQQTPRDQSVEMKFSNLPYVSNPRFYERKEEMTAAGRLIEHFNSRDDKKKRNCVDIFIAGSPGSGKSELAIKLAETYIDSFNIIYWCHADEYQILNNEITDLFELLNSSQKVPISSNKSIDLKYRWIGIWLTQMQMNCLLIYDDVQCLRNISKMMPKPHERIFKIVTSLHDSWTQVSEVKINLENFSEKTVEEILCRELQVPSSLSMESVAGGIGGLPLTVNIAVATLTQKDGITVGDYGRKLVEYSKEIHEYDIQLFKVLKVVLEIILKETHGILAIRFIKILAYTKSYKIPIKLFSNTDKNYLDALLLLKTFSLIHYDEKYVEISQHIQQVMQYISCNETEALTDLFTLLETKTESNNGVMTFSDSKYSQHVMKAWSYLVKYEDIIKRFYCIFFVIAQSTGRLSTTERNFFNENLPILEIVLGWENEVLLQLQLEYAKLLYKGHESLKLEQMYDRVLSNLPDHLKEHKIVQQLFYWEAMSLCQQGIDFRGLSDRGKIETALTMFQKLYQDYQDMFSREELLSIVNQMCKVSALLENESVWNECLIMVENLIRQINAEKQTLAADLETFLRTLELLVSWHEVNPRYAVSLCDTITRDLAQELQHHEIVLAMLDCRASSLKGQDPEAAFSGWRDLYQIHLARQGGEERKDVLRVLEKMCLAAAALEEKGDPEPWTLCMEIWRNIFLHGHVTSEDLIEAIFSTITVLQCYSRHLSTVSLCDLALRELPDELRSHEDTSDLLQRKASSLRALGRQDEEQLVLKDSRGDESDVTKRGK